jgi:hypothetical protein
MPGSLGGGTPAQPAAPHPGPIGQPGSAMGQTQLPDFYRALFSGGGGLFGAGGAPPAAGYGA